MSLQTSEATEAASLSAPPRRAMTTPFAGGFSPMLRGPQVVFAPEDDAGQSGAIGLDDAVTLLSAMDEAPEPEDDTDTEADPEGADDGDAEAAADEDTEASDQEADGDDAPEEDPASEDEPDEDAEAEPAEPVIEPPRFWSAEERALFAKAPPEVQHLVAAKDAEAEKRVYAAKEEAAAARKDASVIAQVREVIDQQVERAQTIFQGKWDGVDWAQWARDNPQEAIAAKFEYDQEQEELSKLQTAQAATASEEHRQFLQAEAVKLRDSGHVLADPVRGPVEKRALVEYAAGTGYSPDDLKWAGARELDTLHKAMLWDRAQAKAKADPPKPKPEPAKAEAPKKAPGPVRPAAPAPPRKSVIQRQKQEVVGKAMKSGRMDDAVAALLAMEGR